MGDPADGEDLVSLIEECLEDYEHQFHPKGEEKEKAKLFDRLETIRYSGPEVDEDYVRETYMQLIDLYPKSDLRVLLAFAKESQPQHTVQTKGSTQYLIEILEPTGDFVTRKFGITAVDPSDAIGKLTTKREISASLKSDETQHVNPEHAFPGEEKAAKQSIWTYMLEGEENGREWIARVVLLESALQTG